MGLIEQATPWHVASRWLITGVSGGRCSCAGSLLQVLGCNSATEIEGMASIPMAILQGKLEGDDWRYTSEDAQVALEIRRQTPAENLRQQLPHETAARICGKNLPHESAAGLCRNICGKNLRQEFSG